MGNSGYLCIPTVTFHRKHSHEKKLCLEMGDMTSEKASVAHFIEDVSSDY